MMMPTMIAPGAGNCVEAVRMTASRSAAAAPSGDISGGGGRVAARAAREAGDGKSYPR